MRKQLIVLSLMVAIVFVTITAFKAAPKETKDGWKNLKVLSQDISEDSLDAIMDHFKISLGVKCNFCHAPNTKTGKLDFASDDKPEKDIARMMMKMTSEINKNYFNFNNSAKPDTINVVTCYTCHNGNAHPEGMPPMDGNHMSPHGAPPQNGNPPPGMPPPPGGAMPDSTKKK